MTSCTDERTKYIYIVTSYTNTFIGKLILLRARMRFWNRYEGDSYSHVSLSLEPDLRNMMSFARKRMNNPLISGLIRENIRAGMFTLYPERSRIAVMQIAVTPRQYSRLSEHMNSYWLNAHNLKYNYPGLISMLFLGRGIHAENSFFCSQWVAEVLKKSDLDLFEGQPSCNIRPFDFYRTLSHCLIFEGKTADYAHGQADK